MADDGDTCGQIEPDWKKRFNTCDIQVQVKTLTEKAFEDFQYNPEEQQTNSEKATAVAAKIREVIQKSGNVKRYKINVQCFLGEKKNQKVTIVARGWWDTYVDNYVTYTYQNDNYYCTVIVWGMYTD